MKGKKSSREIIQSLPPNIVNAQPDFMSEISDRWFKELLELRAKRLHVPLEQAANIDTYSAQFQESIEQLAALEGLTPEAYLEGFARRIGQSTYPTPECLTPNEVLRYAETGAVRPAQQEHVSSCPSCNTLLAASRPPEDGFARIKEELRHLVTVQPERPALQPQPAYADIPLRARLAWVMKPAALVSAGAVAVLAIVTGLIIEPVAIFGPRVQWLAVVPNQGVSKSGDVDSVAYGMTEVLSNDLSSLKELRVVGNNSVMHFQNTNLTPIQIARQLNVDKIAVASVAHEGDRLQISAQLINASTNKNLWSQRFEGDLVNALQLQGEVARTIAGVAGVKLTPDEQTRLSGANPVAPPVLMSYLEGRYRLSTRKEDDLRAGLEDFRKAVEDDPKFALGWASLADSYNLLALRGYMLASEAYPKAKESANKALALDPNLGNAHAALALNQLYYEFNWGEAEKDFRRALQLNPSYAEAHHWYGLLLSALKRHREAIQELKLAVELEPLSPPISTALGDGYFLAREYDQAIKQYNKTLQKFPSYGGAKRNLASVYVQTGKFQEAVNLLQQVHDNKGDLAYTYVVWGRAGEARNLLPELKDPIETAVVYGALGERDHAFEWLDKAYEERSFLLFQLAIDPSLDSLRSDSRFQELLRRINYPDAK
jgi:TolB-like protein/tetratricopeptide (TPR) repeat protein